MSGGGGIGPAAKKKNEATFFLFFFQALNNIFYFNLSYDEGGTMCPPKVFLFFYQKSLPLTKPWDPPVNS